jgi:ubiquinone/menaquinone biosynthesis C-methylase UbiE
VERMNEAEWKEWLHRRCRQVLKHAGVGKDSVVLDFGCGSGVYALCAAELVGEAGKVYALDKSPTELAKVEQAAREQGFGNVETILSSDLTTGLPDGCARVVLLHDMLHMIDAWEVLFQAVHKVLCPQGRVSIYPMHVDRDEVVRQMEAGGFSLRAEHYEGHILIFEREG